MGEIGADMASMNSYKGLTIRVGKQREVDYDSLLEPCGFCGGKPRLVRNEIRDRDCAIDSETYVECRSCGARSKKFYTTCDNRPHDGISEDPEADAINFWNRRVTVPPELQEQKILLILETALSALETLKRKGENVWHMEHVLTEAFWKCPATDAERSVCETYKFNCDKELYEE